MGREELSNFIHRRINDLNLTKAEVVRQSGLSRAGLYKLLDQDVGQAKIVTFVKLAVALRVHPLDLMRRLFSGQNITAHSQQGQMPKYPRDASHFIRDITYPDNSLVTAGEEFEKKWEFQNTGDIPWIGRKLILADGHLEDPVMLGALMPIMQEVPISPTNPGETTEVAVVFKAPRFPCTTVSYWKMIDGDGELCFPDLTGLYCRVRVVQV